MQGSGALRGSHGGSEGFCSPSSKNTHSSQPCGGILKPFGGLRGLVPQRGIWITHLKEHRHSVLLAQTNHGDWRWIRFTQRVWVVTHCSSTSQMSSVSGPNSKNELDSWQLVSSCFIHTTAFFVCVVLAVILSITKPDLVDTAATGAGEGVPSTCRICCRWSGE